MSVNFIIIINDKPSLTTVSHQRLANSYKPLLVPCWMGLLYPGIIIQEGNYSDYSATMSCYHYNTY